MLASKEISEDEQIAEFTKTLRVLYVEDDELIAKSASSLMNRYFGTLIYAENGKIGLELYKDGKYDIVISDVQMPYLDGINMTKAIKEINPLQKIIITSASDDSEKLMQLIDVGVDKFLQKPISRKKLSDTIYYISREIYHEKELERYKKRIEDINNYNLEEQLKAHKKQKNIIINDLEDDNRFVTDTIYIASDILSGDSYSIYKRYDGSIFMYVIDAMGHGLLPSLTSFAISSAVKSHIKTTKSFFDFSKEFIETIKNTLVDEEQLSCVFLEIDADFKKLEYFSAGMYPGSFLDEDKIVHLKTNNQPLMNFDENIITTTLELNCLKTLTIFSDGVVEEIDGIIDLSSSSKLLDRDYFLKVKNQFIDNPPNDDITLIRLERL